MITTFEEITKDYSEKELNYYIPLIVRGLETKIGKKKAISTPEIIEKLHVFDLKKDKEAKKLRPERIRMMVRYIAITDSIIGIQGGGKGYWVAECSSDLDDPIQSIDDRIKALATRLKALKRHQLVFKNNEIKNMNYEKQK